MKKLKRAGISIAEMCIVLAVIAIASTVVITFTIMVSARSSASVTKLNAYNDIQVSQVILENWMDSMHTEGAYVNTEGMGLQAVKKNGENVEFYLEVYLQDGQLVAPLPDGTELTCPISTVKEFRFSQLPEATVDRNVLYFCTVAYEVQNPTGEYVPFEETFTIRPRVGQTQP